MTYQSEVLADTPVAYWRLDELFGSTFVDIANGHNGTFDALSQLGFMSPIETDPNSRSVYGPAGLVPTANGSPLDIQNDITLEGWLYYDTAHLSGGSAHMLNRRGQWGLTHSVQIGFNNSSIQVELALTNGSFYDVIAPNVLQDKTWYHIVGVRIATVLLLYVNGAFAGQNNTLTNDPIDYNVGNSPWGVGRSINTTAFSPVGFDEPAIYNYGSSATRIKAHYDAALFHIQLNGISNGTSTAVLSSEIRRQRVSFGFQHNLEYDIRETLAFRTPIITSRDITEQRMGNRTNPRRTLEYVVSPYGNDGRLRRLLHSTLFGGGLGFYKLPMFTDESIITNITPGQTVLPIDTTSKDYDAGGLLRIWKDESSFEYCSIQSVASNSVTLSMPGVVGTYSRALVAPSRLSVLASEGEIEDVQTGFENLRLNFDIDTREVSTNRFPAFNVSQIYRGAEVFNLYRPSLEFYHRETHRTVRRDERVDYEYGPFSIVQRRRAVTGGLVKGTHLIIAVSITMTSQAKFSELLSWFSYHAGMRVPCWLPTWQRDFKLISQIDPTITIEWMGYTLNYGEDPARDDIAFIKADGTIITRRILSSVDNLNGTETLTLDQNLGVSITTIERTSFLLPCRLDHDMIEMRYHDWSRGGSVDVILHFTSLAYEVTGSLVLSSQLITEGGQGIITEDGHPIIEE